MSRRAILFLIYALSLTYYDYELFYIDIAKSKNVLRIVRLHILLIFFRVIHIQYILTIVDGSTSKGPYNMLIPSITYKWIIHCYRGNSVFQFDVTVFYHYCAITIFILYLMPFAVLT